jgi:hypothetical protein
MGSEQELSPRRRPSSISGSREQKRTAKKVEDARSLSPVSGYYKLGLSALLTYLAVAGAWAFQRGLSRLGPLPESYALCSRDQRGVYTVDQNNPNVQCIVVNNEWIVDRGTLGMSKPLVKSRVFKGLSTLFSSGGQESVAGDPYQGSRRPDDSIWFNYCAGYERYGN